MIVYIWKQDDRLWLFLQAYFETTPCPLKFQCHHRPVKDMLRHYTADSMVECKLNCSMDPQSICKSPITCCPIGLLRKQHNARVNSPVSKTCMKYCAGVLFGTDILFLIYSGYSFSEGWKSYKHLYIVYVIIMSALHVMCKQWQTFEGGKLDVLLIAICMHFRQEFTLTKLLNIHSYIFS